MLINHKLFMLSAVALGLWCCKSDSAEIAKPVAPQVSQPQVKKLPTTTVHPTVSAQIKTDSTNNAEVKTEETKVTSEASQVTQNERSEKSSQHKVKPSTTKAQPAIEFEKIRHDFGEIIQGDTVDFKFTFANTGQAPLVINSAKATCGCTQPSFPFVPIDAGEEGYIGVRYISVGKEGMQKPTITVYTNVSKEPITLMMTGRVELDNKEEKRDSSALDTIVAIDSIVTETTLDTLKAGN